MMKTLIAAFLFYLTRGPVAEHEKTVFVNCVNFYSLASPSFSYDDVNIADRPLDWDPSLTFEDSVLKKAEYIQEIGGDVYQYAVPFGLGNTSSSTYDPALDFSRLKDIHHILADNNIDLKVNFETSGFNTQYESGRYTVGNMAAFLDYAATNVFHWPKIFKYDNRVVFTLWNMFGADGGSLTSGFTPEVYEGVLDAMQSGNREKLYIVNDSFHNYLMPTNQWDSSHIQAQLETGLFDNIELWATTSEPDADAYRQQKLQADIGAVSVRTPFAVCVSSGYYRRNIQSFKRHYGTRHFFDHWKSRVTDRSPDWITVITMDDYSENHHIEPSVLNNGFWLSLLKTKIKHWRGEANNMSPEYWLATPQVNVWGQNMYTEVIELNSASTEHKMKVQLRDQNGAVFDNPLAKSENAAFCGGAVKVYRFDRAMTNAALMDAKVLRPVAYRYSNTGVFQRTYWGCPPVRQFYNVKPGTLFRYTPLHDLISVSGDGGATISSVAFTDKLEYRETTATYTLDAHGYDLASATVCGVRDHLPVFSTSFSGTGSTASFSLTVDSHDLQDAAAMSYVCYRTEEGKLYYSAPAIRTNDATGGYYYLYDKTVESTNYNSKEADFNELDRDFRFNDKEMYVANWDCTETQDVIIGSASYNIVPSYRNYWGRPLYLGYGPNKKTYSGTSANEPLFKTSGLQFDGDDDVCRLPDYVLPEGAIGIYLKFTADTVNRDQILIYSKGVDQANALIGITVDDRIYFERNGERVVSSFSVSSQTECEVWCYDNGSKQALKINGSYNAIRSYTPKPKSLVYHRNNDLVLVGDNHIHTDGDAFGGLISKIMVVSALPGDGQW